MVITKPVSRFESLPILLPGAECRKLSGRKWHIGMYGLSGSGKTFQIGTAGESKLLAPVLLVDMEEGDITIDSWGFPNVDLLRVEEYREGLEHSTPSRKPSLEDCFDEILSAIEEEAALPDFKYNLVAFDGGTRLQNWCDEAIVEEARRRPASGQGSAHDPELSSLADFRRVASRMAIRFWRVKRLPVHTVFTAKERLLETENSKPDFKIYSARANFYPKTLDEFEGCWDVLARLHREMVGTIEQYLFETRLSMRHVAKSRAKGLESKIVDPDLGKIFSQLIGGGES